jgi:LysM repeat protein
MASIARQFNTTLSRLTSANPQISNPNLIFTGQRINIP